MKGILLILILALIGTAWYFVPASHHHASTGTYFLNQYISFTTPNGMTGWAPGQEVHEVLKAPFVQGNKTVTDGTSSAVVSEAVLTQDIEDAEDMRLADATNQNVTKSSIASLKQHIATRNFSAQLTSASDMTRMNAQQVAASTVGLYSTRLSEPARAVGTSGYYAPYAYYGSPGGGSYTSNSTAYIFNGSHSSTPAPLPGAVTTVQPTPTPGIPHMSFGSSGY